MDKKWKFGALFAIIIGTLIWLGAANVSESQTYYKTIAELKQMDAESGSKRLRVAGDIVEGSIQRREKSTEFLLKGEGEELKVIYSGIDPLPDTFKDGAQCLAEGKLAADGTFQAGKIQAKCASKYAPKPGQGTNPSYPSKTEPASDKVSKL